MLATVALVLVVLAVRAGSALVWILHVGRIVRGGDWFGVVWHLVPSLKNCDLRFVEI